MALDWLPLDASPARKRLRRPAAETVAPFSPASIVVPDVLASLTFFPVLQLHRHYRTRVHTPEIISPFTDAIRPLAWLPLSLLRRRLPPRRARIDTIEPPPSLQTSIAERMGWIPAVADRLPHHRPSAAASVTVTPLSVIAAKVLCTELADDA